MRTDLVASTTVTTTPTVTLTPTYHGRIPGDANDGADFWGIGLALVGIVLAVVIVRLLFRTRPSRGRHVRSR